MRSVPWVQSHWRSPFSPEHQTIHWANTPQLFLHGSFNLHHPAAGEKLNVHRCHCSHDPFCNCDLQSWWKHPFGLVAASAKPVNGTDLIVWILIILNLFQRQEVILVGLWALISRELVLQDKLWTLSTFWKGPGHICSFKLISMPQWSHWDLVSSRLGQDQRKFWKAVVMEKHVSGYQCQGSSLYCCVWLDRLQPLQDPPTGNVAGHKLQGVQACACADGSPQSQCRNARGNCKAILLIRLLPLLKSSWNEVLESTDWPVKTYSGRETPSCFCWQNSLWLPSGGPSTPHPLDCWSKPRTKAGQNQLPESWPQLSAAPGHSE